MTKAKSTEKGLAKAEARERGVGQFSGSLLRALRRQWVYPHGYA